MRSRQTNKPDKYIVSECAKVLRDELPYNLHIFVNSVEFIAKVIDTLKLAPEAVKVVCSTSGESRQENQRKLGNAYPIGQPSDPAKKINFYTSTCFFDTDLNIGRIESGRHSISLTTLADLCDYYNVPLEDFFKKIVTR